MTIPRRFLPSTADNNYSGHKLALWILGLVAVLNGVIGFNSMLNTRSVAMNADGFPLDSFPAGAAQVVLLLFALLGAGRIVMFALSMVVLLRYRALTSLMLATLLLGQLLAQLVHQLRPTPIAMRTAGSVTILTIMGLTVLGLALSLWPKKKLDETRG